MIQLKVYSNLRNAFIFQLIVGFFCLLGIMLIGGQMIALLAFLALRRFFMPSEMIHDPAPYFHFYYYIGKISFVITAITVLVLYVLLHVTGDFANYFVIDPRNWLISILPFFVGVHGVVGLIYINRLEPPNKSLEKTTGKR